MKTTSLLLGLAVLGCAFAHGERINHDGRILSEQVPAVTTPLLFNTAEADAVVSAMQILPRNNAWNERIDRRPLLANSDAMIAQITADLAANRRTLRAFYEMNYVLVPDSQPARAIRFLDYPDESDLDGGTSPNGLYPIPDNLPVETWPRETGTLTLDQWQRDVNNAGGDRHSIIVKPGAGSVWETWQTKKVGEAWQASNGAKFPLNTNAQRPDGWTSGDAAGLSMFAGLVRYDECARGMVEHAIRIVVKKSRRAYLYPATHFASTLTGANYPAMGQRLRLKANFNVPSTWTIHEKAVCAALKKYGAIVADNGGFFSVSVAPDSRFPSNAFDNLSTVAISNFEVIQSTGASEGPRTAGAPDVNAGRDIFQPWTAVAALSGTVTDPDAPQTPVSIQWSKYAGPGTVTFGNAAQAATTATFSLPGRYTLLLTADDGVHTPAYDAVVVNAMFAHEVLRTGNDVHVRFPTASGHTYRVERAATLSATPWMVLADQLSGTGSNIEIIHAGAFLMSSQFYRVTVLH